MTPYSHASNAGRVQRRNKFGAYAELSAVQTAAEVKTDVAAFEFEGRLRELLA